MKSEKKESRPNTVILVIFASVIFAVVGFFAGTRYQKGKVGNDFMGQRMMGQGRQFGDKNAGPNFGANIPVSGEITAVDGKTITVKVSDGGSKIIILSDSSLFYKSEKAQAEDLKNGEKIMVMGLKNSDGTITAKSVSIGESIMPMKQNMP